MQFFGVSYDSALLTCRKSRHCVYPNPGFQHQLREYDRKLMQKRFEQDQRTGGRYLNDYTKINKFINQTQRSITQQPAGLDSNHYQFNQGGTKDRLGANGLIRRGMSTTNSNVFSKELQNRLLEKTMTSMQFRNSTQDRHRNMLQSWKQTDLGNPFSSYYRDIDQDSFLRQNPDFEPIRKIQRVTVDSRDTAIESGRNTKFKRSAMKSLGSNHPVKPHHSFVPSPIPHYSNGQTRGRPTTAAVKTTSFRKNLMTPDQRQFAMEHLNRKLNQINGLKQRAKNLNSTLNNLKEEYAGVRNNSSLRIKSNYYN